MVWWANRRQLGLAPYGVAAGVHLRRHGRGGGCRSAASSLDAWVGVLHAGEPARAPAPWLDVPRLSGERVVLRPCRDDDAPRIVEACADERTAHWLCGLPSPYTRDDAGPTSLPRDEQRAGGVAVWRGRSPTRRRTGCSAASSLFDLRAGRDAEVGYWTHPDARGRGVMTEACGLAVRHGLAAADRGGLGLRRIGIRAAAGNAASRRVIEANGFVPVGRERLATRLRDGTMVDTECFDLLLEEYDGPPT